jgi:hypothetical protein
MANWILHQSHATLDHCGVHGEVDLAKPAGGLGRLIVDNVPVENASILGINLDPHSDAPVDAYVRCGDLVATYPETPNRPARVQIYWRAGGDQGTSQAAFVDLQISVQTNELGVPTPIETVSRLPGWQVWRLTKPRDGEFALLDIGGDQELLGPDDGPGCLLFRSGDRRWSYVEMVHPADFHATELTAATRADAAWQLRHRLFPDALEKGVILRGRIRAAWLPPGDDQALASALYRALVDMPPPLTT